MNTGDWELEMNRLMEIFEQESTLSLRKISRCFAAINRPFNEDFHQYLVKMSNLRLGASFNRVLFERLNENQIQSSSSSSSTSTASANVSTNDNGIASSSANANIFIPSEGNAVHGNIPENTNATTTLKIETNVEAPIEIVDSDEESDEVYYEISADDGIIGKQVESNAVSEDFNDGKENADGGHIDIESSSENVVEDDVKHEIKGENEIEMMDLPFERFDPNKANYSSSIENGRSNVRYARKVFDKNAF